ncbi:MAG: MFS transporter [Acidobacteria bacterium]|nr:MFS transporter [Acidobacteriota bacterium]
MFGYGFLSVILVLYLAETGLGETRIGLLLTLTLVGDTLLSLWLTTRADRFGRRRTLVIGALLMTIAGVLFATTRDFTLLLLAATVGVISPSGNEVGPFLPIEQSALAQTVPNDRRTHLFAWYNLAGSFGTAVGALAAGVLTRILAANGYETITSYRIVILGYATIGILLATLFTLLTPAVETRVVAHDRGRASTLGLNRSRSVVARLSALFALDAFAGGFVIQSLVAYWFHVRFGADPGLLGALFFAANILAGVSALCAARVAHRIGLVNTMVFTHLPSNVLLVLVPLMPNLGLAIALLLARFAISQMDVPTRQSYVMAVVDPEERSAAAGITGVARTVGASIAPVIAGPMLASAALASLPFFVAGGLKIIYDLVLWRSFRALPPRQ